MLLGSFIKIAFQHGCSPVNLPNIFRAPFPKNSSGELFLHIHWDCSYFAISFGSKIQARGPIKLILSNRVLTFWTKYRALFNFYVLIFIMNNILIVLGRIVTFFKMIPEAFLWHVKKIHIFFPISLTWGCRKHSFCTWASLVTKTERKTRRNLRIARGYKN